MNHISWEPSFREALALSRASGTHLTVTHSSLDHRGQTLCARYQPIRPCNGHLSVCEAGWCGWAGVVVGAFGDVCHSAKSRQFARPRSNGSARAVWDVIRGWPWKGRCRFGEESEINTELLMFVPAIDLSLSPSRSSRCVQLSRSFSFCVPDWWQSL